jgi:hypothetical protein
LISSWQFVQRDQIGGVFDDGHVAPSRDEHTDVPLQYWRDHMRRKRQQERNRREQEKETPEKPVHGDEDRPPGSIDEYA